jgi:polysaccharide pyruvyl transferase WcaK-like protein
MNDSVLVVGAYGYGNVGDEAILAGLLSRLDRRRVTVMSRAPRETAAAHAVRAIGIGRALPALLTHRTVVIGGGGVFGRDMGRIGRLLPAFGLLAKAFRRRVTVEGVDLDTRLSASARLLVPNLLRACETVSVRDRASAAIAREWGVAVEVLPDLSSRMSPAAPETGRRALARIGLDTQRPIVGLALTAVNHALADDVLEATIRTIHALPEAQFVFVPMSRHPRVAVHDDVQFALRIARSAPLSILEEPLPPREMLAVFGQLTAVVAMRYHAMLFAARCGTPLIPIPYAEKTERWLVEHGRRGVPAEPEALISAARDALEAARAPNPPLLVAS